MTEEIKKLCAEIKPETLRTYAKTKGWGMTGFSGEEERYILKYREYYLRIPTGADLKFRRKRFVECVEILSEAEDRPILAILFDLWLLQNPNLHPTVYTLKVLSLYGLKVCSGALTRQLEEVKKETPSKDKRIAELEIHLSALVDIEMYIIPADKDLVSMSFQDAKMCLMGMTPIKDKYEEGLKKKIADLEAEVRRLKDGQG